MKVWIVLVYWDYEGSYVKGVFSTEEKADAFACILAGRKSYTVVEEWEIK